MRRIASALILALFVTSSLFAIEFSRVQEVPVPEDDLNNGGTGAMIAGEDTDGDGKKEIFLVNNNWNDGASELIPRIYQLEEDGAGGWDVVWSAVAPVAAQNTWPPLLLDDLDGDGKMELIWMPVNNFAEEANPYRILIYEQESADSDIFGVDDGEGGYAPNAAWTIVDEDNVNLRPFSAEIADIKGDGVKRIIFADRTGNSSGYYFGVITVSDVPDAGDGSETWEIEATAQDFTYGGDNKWDVAVIGNTFYTFDEVVISKVTWNGSDWDYAELDPLPGGITFNAAQVLDIDGDGTEEILVGEYTYGDGTRNIWLLEEDGNDLKRTALIDINGEEHLNGGYLAGGAHGDIDGDGNMDFVFGSRYSGPPNAMVFLVSHKGGAIDNPDNWELSFVDSAYSDGGIWNVIDIANMDDDEELEVIYTSSVSLPGGDLFTPDYTGPIIMMDPESEGPGFELVDFERVQEVPVPEDDLNNGGTGAMIAGEDTDGDGKKEIFLVNNNWNDGASELIPRIYQLEEDGAGGWDVVWSAVAPVAAQNTWPPLLLDDLDGDGKMELIWMPVNNFAEEANPYRILIYEQESADSDIFGVDDGEGGYAPNAAWTIVDEDNVNLRPFSAEIADIKGDGVKRIIFADRTGNSSGYYFGVITVSDVPDAGDGSETWEIEATAQDFTYGGDNKWDVAVIGNTFYTFDEVVISKVTWNGSDWDYAELDPLPGGITFNAAQVLDIDGDGTEEILVGEYTYGDGTRNIWLLEEDGNDLKRTALIDINGEEHLNGGYLAGGAHGDIDGDGNMDFVFGSRYSGPPNAMVFLVSHKGGAIDNPDNWELSFVDSAYSDGGIWNVIDIANMDDDEELEVIYTSSVSLPGGDLFTPDYTGPIIMMDPVGSGVGIDENIARKVLPLGYKLDQNYPNPFNPTTTINFSIPKAEQVRLVIYDMTGRRVNELVNNRLNAGDHSYSWNATDMHGKKVASGVYIYRLQAGNVVKIRRMTLLK